VLFRNIKTKLFLTYLTIILLTTAIFSAALMRFFTDYYRKGKEVALLTHANVVASLSGSYIQDRDGAVKYVAAEFAGKVGARILVLDAAGVILGDSADQVAVVGESLSRPEVAVALNGKSTTTVETIPGTGRVMYVAVPVIAEKEVIGVVFVSASLGEIAELLGELRWELLITALASGMIGGLISYLIAERIAKRLGEMTAAVRAMTGGVLQQRVTVPVRMNWPNWAPLSIKWQKNWPASKRPARLSWPMLRTSLRHR